MGSSQFEILEEIPNSFGRKDRYSYAKVQQDGRVRFLKTGTADDSPENLRRELIWADFMGHVTQLFPDLKVRAPRDVELLSDNELSMEYLDLPLLGEPRNGKAWARHIDRFVDVLVALDLAAADYQLPKHLETFKRRNFDETLKWWLRDLELTDDMIQAVAYAKERQGSLKKRMQHGDLTAWQIFDNGQEWIIYDGERSGDDLPRFNDLAYSYGRLAIRCGEPVAADDMIQLFLKGSGIDRDEFYKVFRPVLVLRLLGMVGDAMRDVNPVELEAAQKLLRCALNEVSR